MSSVENKWKKVLLFKGDKLDSYVIYGAVFLLIVKLILFPFTQTVDADAVSRTLISYKWSQDPYFISDSVWAPLHFYLNGIIMWMTGSIENGPRYLNVLLSCVTLIPFYYFVKNEFSRKGAPFSVAIFALSPIIFRNSFQALSGTPYLFCFVLSLYFFAKAFRSEGIRDYIFAGVSMTLAAGFRYEAWIMIVVFTLIGLLRKQWKGTAIFCGIAMIVPLVWMLVGQIYHGDYLYGINGAYGWNIERMEVNANVNDTERLKRLFFFPMSWFLAVSPILGWVLTISFFGNVFKKIFTKTQYLWMLPLLFLGIAFLVKAQDGTLLLQHRFTGGLVVLSAPLFAMILTKQSRIYKKYIMVVLTLLIIPQSYFWYRVNLDEWTPLSNQIKSIIRDIQLSSGPETLPLPQIDNPLVINSLKTIEDNWRNNDDGLIIDFFGWTETYYIALQYPESEPFIFPGAKNDEFPRDKFAKYVSNHPKGKLVLHCASNHGKFIDYIGPALQSGNRLTLDLNPLYSNKGLNVFEYEYVELEGWTIYPPSVANDCAPIGSLSYFESKAYFSVQQKEEAKRFMRKAGLSFEEAILQVAEIEYERFLKGEIEI